MNRSYPMAELLDALRKYPLPPRRRITIEYTLLAGKNDSPAHAEQLARALGGLRVKVNLIPVNPISTGEYSTPTVDAVDAFRRRLSAFRVSCSVRQRRGDDVSAACGQLALQGGLVKLTGNVPAELKPSPQ
jgi:23S rRNA (adenine2503-C2)-methyltransferase